jgi:hypothetical protein
MKADAIDVIHVRLDLPKAIYFRLKVLHITLKAIYFRLRVLYAQSINLPRTWATCFRRLCGQMMPSMMNCLRDTGAREAGDVAPALVVCAAELVQVSKVDSLVVCACCGVQTV